MIVWQFSAIRRRSLVRIDDEYKLLRRLLPLTLPVPLRLRQHRLEEGAGVGALFLHDGLGRA